MEYNKWKKNHQLSSQKAENFNVENEQVCKKTSGFFEEIDSFSTTLKKLKSPLFRKRNNNSYKKNQKEKVDSGRKS